MPVLLSAKELAERSLRLIGAFPVNETAARPEELREALLWLDLIMAQLGGTGRRQWLVTETLTIPLAASTADYDIMSLLGEDGPADGILFPVEAWIEDSGGNRAPFELVTRHAFEDRAKPGQTGRPCIGYISRLVGDPVLQVWPVPTDATFEVKLVAQTFPKQVAPLGVTANPGQGNLGHGLRETWQRYMIFALAADLGSGAVRRISAATVKEYREEAERARAELEAFEDREHETTLPIVQPYDPDILDHRYNEVW